ncbi:MAG: GIY-YIG nuclease family protein [Candidatus Kapaibacteriota bacterium]
MYILLCSDGTYYVGSTNNLMRRFYQHNSGNGANHTKKRLPVTLAYVEVFDNVYMAYKRERQLHNWGHNKKKALIEANYEWLHILAECKNDSHWKNFE